VRRLLYLGRRRQKQISKLSSAFHLGLVPASPPVRSSRTMSMAISTRVANHRPTSRPTYATSCNFEPRPEKRPIGDLPAGRAISLPTPRRSYPMMMFLGMMSVRGSGAASAGACRFLNAIATARLVSLLSDNMRVHSATSSRDHFIQRNILIFSGSWEINAIVVVTTGSD